MRSRAKESRRATLRRAVTVDCQVLSEYWDEPVRIEASDLSHEGMWLDTPLPLEMGEPLLLSFTPPRTELPITAVARVARVGMWRRARDRYPIGMGLSFTDVEPGERELLRTSLLGIPPRLPRRRLPAPLPPGDFPALSLPPVLDAELHLDEADFKPLAGLITSACTPYRWQH